MFGPGYFPFQGSFDPLPTVVLHELDGILAHFAGIAAQDSFPGKITGTLMVRSLFRHNFTRLQVDGETQLGGEKRKKRPCDRAAERLVKTGSLGRNL